VGGSRGNYVAPGGVECIDELSFFFFSLLIRIKQLQQLKIARKIMSPIEDVPALWW
jgi:hypothetical protein